MKKWKRVMAAGLVLAMSMMSIGGCGSTSSPNTDITAQGSTTEGTASTEPNGGTSTTSEEPLDIVIRSAAELASMDGSLITSGESMQVYRQTSEGLYKYDQEGLLVPGMAEKIEVSEDGLTYTFTIRDAVWSNGTPVTANDFAYSWKRLGNPNTGAEYAYMLTVAGIKNAGAVITGEADVETLGVTALDEKTFVVELERPVAYFPSLLTGTYFLPINEEFCEAQGDQYGLTMENVMACGPFVLTSWQPGDTVAVVTKNESYYDADAIEVNSITYSTIKDTQQAIMAWESGTIDNISITGDMVEMYSSDPGYQSRQASMLWYMAANNAVPGLDNANLRTALALSYDKQAICDNILKNGSIAADFAVPEAFALDSNGVYFRDAANATYLESDKAKAAEYFSKACEELGQTEFNFELLYDDAEDTKNIAQFLQSEIQSTLPGVTITLKVQPKNNRVELMTSHNFELGLTRWGADYQDGTTFLDMWTTGNSYNYGNWSNAEYDALMAEVSGSLAADLEGRVANMIAAEKIVMDEAGILPVYQVCNAYLVNPDIDVFYNVQSGYLWQYATRK